MKFSIEPRAGLRRMAAHLRVQAAALRAEAVQAALQGETCAILLEKEADLMEEKSVSATQMTAATMVKAYLENCPELVECVMPLGTN
jgi:hypothetical protein